LTGPIRIWTCASHHPAFRCGGWASIRANGGELIGFAGGERNTTAPRMALAGVAAALRDIPAEKAHAPIRLWTSSPQLMGLNDILAGAAPGPEADLDLWAPIITAAKGLRLDVTLSSLEPDTPMAFAAAWADLGRDKAKASGAFTAPIPRSNLAKVAGL
jgi:hypothetical protein